MAEEYSTSNDIDFEWNAWSEDAEAMTSFMKDGRFSDVVVVCGDWTWNCHTVILAARSEFFKTELMKMRDIPIPFQGLEALEITDATKEEVDIVIQLLYAGEYINLRDRFGHETLMRSIIRIWKIGVQFEANIVKVAALTALDSVRSDWIMAYQNCVADVTNTTQTRDINEILDHLIDGLEELYEDRDDALYSNLDSRARYHFKICTSLALQTLCCSPRFQKLLCNSQHLGENLVIPAYSRSTMSLRFGHDHKEANDYQSNGSSE